MTYIVYSTVYFCPLTSVALITHMGNHTQKVYRLNKEKQYHKV